ncbi:MULTISPECIES: hypothetical protein [Streptomyces]|uniref:hypothetical protein n=1 Tax=Streptomyces TaxID=1883 RepID=UPI0013178C37|nr:MULTISPECIES: hypothetical protein [Streptomyces]QGZ51451.1 hypothetical protein GPZ77_26455 [Streptomyces sp. QHH-9511]GGU06978.1 hypothetical protein GCM10010272_60320 [Streptomyces lateritius]
MRTRQRPPARTGLGVLFLLLAQALALATPAQAHGDTVKVVITGQREGHLTTDITWENDGDAIEEAVAATVNATSVDGTRTVGPWKLVRDSGTRTGWSTAEVLPPGAWKVHVHIGFPALGHAEREVSVPVVDPAPPSISAAPTAPVPAPAPASPSATAVPSATASAQPAPASDGSTFSWTTTGLALAALAGAAFGVLLVRRARARRQPRGDG